MNADESRRRTARRVSEGFAANQRANIPPASPSLTRRATFPALRAWRVALTRSVRAALCLAILGLASTVSAQTAQRPPQNIAIQQRLDT
jgi:hypothetical protein